MTLAKNCGTTTRMIVLLLKEKPHDMRDIMKKTGCSYMGIYTTLYNLVNRKVIIKNKTFSN
jgi:predicted transcriptional regulator